MQACRALHHSAATVRVLLRSRTAVGHKRFFADIVNAQSERVSILLQRTVSLLPRIPFTVDGAVGPESSHFWSNVLERSIIKLSSDSDSKATIAICGFDKWACAHHLVTALLEDLFTSDPTYSEILRDRWKDNSSCVNVEYGKPAAFSGDLFSPSDWLQQFPQPVRLTELPDLSAPSNMDHEADSLLLGSDILVLLCDPAITPLSDLAVRTRHLLNRPNSILVLTSGSSSDSDRSRFISRTLSGMGCSPGHILYIDPRQALEAVASLQASPASPSAIDRYQKDTLGSRISTITATIGGILDLKNTLETPLLRLREETALSQMHGSLSAGFRSMNAAKNDVDRVASNANDLLSEIQRIQEHARDEVLGKPGEDSKVEQALSQSAKDMDTLLGSLTFWKMVWRVDEIGSLVSTAIQEKWCKELENQLVLQTGRLDATQKELSVSVTNLLSAASSASLGSVVLENKLEQLTRSPSYVLTTSSLTRPIYDRRNQLIRHTTTKLHRDAQSAVVGVFSGALSGAGLGWWLSFGEHIIGLGTGTEMGTALGAGALLAVGSVRWAVGKWERAKQRWVQDSARIGEGLSRDLQNTVQRTVDDNVIVVASTACKGVRDLVDKRCSEIQRLHGELCDLETELHAYGQLPAS